MRYRFHYQGSQGTIVAMPIVEPARWLTERVSFIAIADIEATTLAQAYQDLSRAISWWNDQVKAETIIDGLDDGAFTFEGVKFFMHSDLRESLKYNPDHHKVRSPAKRLPLRQPLPGDVFEPLERFAYMLAEAPQTLQDQFQWFFIPSLFNILLVSEEVKKR